MSEIYFKEELTDNEKGRPVGLDDRGVMVWKFPERVDALAIIPYDEIDEVCLERESRM